MNDQSQMMMNQSQMMMNQQSQLMSQSGLNQSQLMNQNAQMLNQSSAQLMNQNQQSQMLNRSYGVWPPPPQPTMAEAMKFPKNPLNQKGFPATKPPGRKYWKGKKGNVDKRMLPGGGAGGVAGGVGSSGAGGGGGGYKPPTLNELQHQNRLKARKFYPNKKYNRFAPFAPRNTTSYIIRAKKSGGIASLVSPCPVTPAVLPTPIFSPSREVLVDMAKEEWGVDGYGSMKGLIRLRSPGNEADAHEDEEEEEGGSSESDVEEHVEVERRLDHDLSRFEMIYPNSGGEYNNVLENRVDDQDTHIAQLEEENLILKERLFLMERELGDLRRRMLALERRNQVVEGINEEVVENMSDNESEGRRGDVRLADYNNEEVVEENDEGREDNVVEPKEEKDDELLENEFDELFVEKRFKGVEVGSECLEKNESVGDEGMEEAAPEEENVIAENQSKDGVENGCSEKNIDNGDLSVPC